MELVVLISVCVSVAFLIGFFVMATAVCDIRSELRKLNALMRSAGGKPEPPPEYSGARKAHQTLMEEARRGDAPAEWPGLTMPEGRK